MIIKKSDATLLSVGSMTIMLVRSNFGFVAKGQLPDGVTDWHRGKTEHEAIARCLISMAAWDKINAPEPFAPAVIVPPAPLD